MNFLINADRRFKYLIYLLIDTIIIVFSLYLSVSIRQETLFHYENLKSSLIFLYFVPVFILGNYYILGIHKIFLRNFSSLDFKKFFFFSLNISFILSIYLIFFQIYLPRSVILISFLINLVLLILSRLVLKKIILEISNTSKSKIIAMVFFLKNLTP